MKYRWMKSPVPAVLLTTSLIGTTALALGTANRRPPAPEPDSRVQANPDRISRASDSRDLRTLIEDLESSPTEDIRSGRISRFFTDPAVIITNGQMHHIDWSRVRNDGNLDRDTPDKADRNADPRDRDADPKDQDAPPPDPADRNVDPRDRDVRDNPRDADVTIESFETHRIDPRTVCVMYTAVFPSDNGDTRQPVVATLVREPGSRTWRVASYTAENAALPGGANVDNTDRERLPAR